MVADLHPTDEANLAKAEMIAQAELELLHGGIDEFEPLCGRESAEPLGRVRRFVTRRFV